jgi:hypothetical protein
VVTTEDFMKIDLQTLDHPSQLRGLLHPMRRRSLGSGPLRLGGTLAEHPQRAQWERALLRELNACGCGSAAAGLLVGLLLVAPLGAGGLYLAGHLSTAAGAALVLGIGLAGGLIGKGLGLLRARRRLASLVQEVTLQWPVPADRFEERAHCG